MILLFEYKVWTLFMEFEFQFQVMILFEAIDGKFNMFLKVLGLELHENEVRVAKFELQSHDRFSDSFWPRTARAARSPACVEHRTNQSSCFAKTARVGARAVGFPHVRPVSLHVRFSKQARNCFLSIFQTFRPLFAWFSSIFHMHLHCMNTREIKERIGITERISNKWNEWHVILRCYAWICFCRLSR